MVGFFSSLKYCLSKEEKEWQASTHTPIHLFKKKKKKKKKEGAGIIISHRNQADFVSQHLLNRKASLLSLSLFLSSLSLISNKEGKLIFKVFYSSGFWFS